MNPMEGGKAAHCDYPAQMRTRLQFRYLLTALPRRLLTILMEWQRRANERTHLRDLGIHHIEDAGLSLSDRDQEVRKPFWKP